MLTPTKTGLSTLALAASCGVRCLEVRTSCGVRSSRARRRVSARRAGGDGAWATVLDLDVPGAGRIVGVAMPQGVGVERARPPPPGSPVLAELAPASRVSARQRLLGTCRARPGRAPRARRAAGGRRRRPGALLDWRPAPRAPPAVASVSHKRPLAAAAARAAEAGARGRRRRRRRARARPRAGAARLARRVVRADSAAPFAARRRRRARPRGALLLAQGGRLGARRRRGRGPRATPHPPRPVRRPAGGVHVDGWRRSSTPGGASRGSAGDDRYFRPRRASASGLVVVLLLIAAGNPAPGLAGLGAHPAYGPMGAVDQRPRKSGPGAGAPADRAGGVHWHRHGTGPRP